MAENQTRSVVVYDGLCLFCTKQVARMRKRDRFESFEYVARQTPGLDERFPQLAEGDFNAGMRLIPPSGEVFVGSDAVYQIARKLPYWRRLAWLYCVPGIHALARGIYAWIAANRNSLAGKASVDASPAEGLSASDGEADDATRTKAEG